MLLCLSLALLLGGCDIFTEGSSSRLKALQVIVDEVPVHPGFEYIDSTTISKTTGATISRYYHSSAAFDDVERFYADALQGKGWSVPEEKHFQRLFDGESRQLTFRKGDYSISIDHETDTSYGWDYSLAFNWEPKK